MLMVRDSILVDERSSGAEDGLLRKTQTEEKKKRYLGLFFRRVMATEKKRDFSGCLGGYFFRSRGCKKEDIQGENEKGKGSEDPLTLTSLGSGMILIYFASPLF